MTRRLLLAALDHLIRAAAYSALATVLLLAATVTPAPVPAEPFVPRQLTEQERVEQDRQLLEQALDELHP